MPDVVVTTSAGQVRGTWGDGVQAFRGMPYGGPTGGANRFQAPTPVTPWTDVRDAVALGPACPQAPLLDSRPADVRRRELMVLGFPGEDEAGAEDCLVLNVWTPEAGDGARRPVMVWFHGGGFVTGSSNWPLYDGASLARRGDVVVVTVNHRVGVLGFLDLEAVAPGRFPASGTAGLLDLVAALRWVRHEIEAFGGDPGNVTIFGESGGFGKVAAVMAMPEAAGLFHRAILQSGSPAVSTPDVSARVTAAVLDQLGIDAADVDQLLELPVERLVAPEVVGRAMGTGGLGPVVGRQGLPLAPLDAIAAGAALDVSILTGTTRDEMRSALYFAPDLLALPDGLAPKLGMLVGPSAEDLLSTYRRTRPDASDVDLLLAVLGDRMRVGGPVRVAEHQLAAGGEPPYVYVLMWGTPVDDGVLGSCHMLDVPLVFDNLDAAGMTAGVPAAKELAAVMSETWAAFARDGRPSHPTLPAWPAYELDGRATMLLDETSRLALDPDGEERQAWDGVV